MLNKESDAPPFIMHKAVKPGSRVDAAPKVVSIHLAKLNVNNLKYIPWQAKNMNSSSSIFCPYHDECLGHLQSSDGKNIGLPPFCARADDPTEMSETDRLNKGLMNHSIHPRQYAISLRNCIAGKRGILKYKCMGFTPATSMRGVASCHWSEDYRTVMIPERWMSRIKVITRKESQDLISPYYSIRNACKGDYAILSRSPVMSHNSTQCVKLLPWKHKSIGIHPEFCSLLNLDYDGDEVHICIIDGSSARREAQLSMERNILDKFSSNTFKECLEDFWHNRQIDMKLVIDFMLPSTMSLTDVGYKSPSKKLHKLCRAKAELWNIVEFGCNNRAKRMKSFVRNSNTAIHELTESHIRVSEGFTVGRQLKHLLLQTTSNKNILNTLWLNDQSNNIDTMICNNIKDEEAGYPGTKLSSEISGKIQQALLDKAKHAISAPKRDLILSILTHQNGFSIVEYPDKSRKLVPEESYYRVDEKLLYSLSRSQLSRENDVKERFRRCIIAIDLGCKLNNIKATRRQVVEFAHCIWASTFNNHSDKMTDSSQIKFLAKTKSPSLLTAVCDDIYELDLRKGKRLYDTTMDSCNVMSAVMSIITGNYIYQTMKSEANF
ncbi:hypothetical protein HDU92_004521 [Lobulomyces angularis]|nr:hypothetical protein HDU92_004521 [Lobulomyces angularis]